MMKKIFVLLFCAQSFSALAQTDSLIAVSEIISFQKKLDAEYKNREESPLEPKDFKKFKGHFFFPINLAYRVTAKLVVTPNTPFLGLKTTTTRLTADRIYGFVEFKLDGKEFRLPVYQSQSLMQQAEYVDYLFFPFTDLTNSKKSYAGGRYIDLRIPKEGDSIIVDFNQAYNPYCAYNHKYSCPLVPPENQIEIEIPAGVMYIDHK